MFGDIVLNVHAYAIFGPIPISKIELEFNSGLKATY